jgi:hypothetical protein
MMSIEGLIRGIRGIAGLLMCHQNHDSDCQAAAEAIWDLAREAEEILEKENSGEINGTSRGRVS